MSLSAPLVGKTVMSLIIVVISGPVDGPAFEEAKQVVSTFFRTSPRLLLEYFGDFTSHAFFVLG